MNDYSIFLLDALEQVLGWDLPDETSIIYSANQLARLLACDLDHYEGNYPDS